jgi:predicted aldo/keto reductase-like oxidoreductase
MKYRKFGRLDWNVSALGFGIMRMPIIGNDAGNINEPESIKMIKHAIDNGVNYFDSAYGYHRGNSEVLLGKALKNGYREKIKLATKMPMWLVEKREDLEAFFNTQLERLQTEHIDFYLLHNVDKTNWFKVDKFDVLG